ncbi:hypothetical protein CBER1_00424 [Cercospora berteroae]|uniref:AAA+ ATPase domain-containing protein n=1 Tax=Cercospora berteroae TaxID=357750 RepID=A0A2S6C1B2_9PEZI|nr:hypothetical protein CBER1_00424 [Cercospora berteroae]
MPAPSTPMPIHLSLSLFEVATGLRSGTAEIFDLNAEKVCKNALRIVQRRSPFLAKAISTLVPIAFLGYGSYLYLWKPLRLQTAIDYVTSFFFAEVVVEGSDTVRQHVKDWIADQTSSLQGRSVTLVREGTYGRSSETPYKYISSAQTSWFKYDGRWLRFEDQEVAEKPAESDDYGRRGRSLPVKPDLKISCLSLTGNNGPLRDFLEHIQDDNKDESYTYIYRVSRYSCDNDVWDQPISRPVRTLDTVAMEVATRQAIIASVETYLAPETSSWYAQRGLPLRKGILLHGPPGTGKTSFSTALAGHFGLDLYILSFTSTEMDDGKLATLFAELPTQCVVLMEDVDSAGVERENIVKPSSDLLTPKKRVTLSGLLNVIDGAGASEGRLLIMTSNSANSLDPALVRPGRIDHKIFMGNASQEVANILFTQIYTDLDEEFDDSETVVDSQPDIDVLAKTFASKVEANLFTPAEIQAFLLSHRESPEEALDCVDDWAEKLKDIKVAGHNVKEGYSTAASQASTIAANDFEERKEQLQHGRPISRRHSWSYVDATVEVYD